MKGQPQSHSSQFRTGKQNSVAAEVLEVGPHPAERHEKGLKARSAGQLQREEVMPLQPFVMIGQAPPVDRAKRKMPSQGCG